MKTLNLTRLPGQTAGTFGVLTCDGVPFCVTLERPWISNQASISCIPKGTYVVKWGPLPPHIKQINGVANGWEVTQVAGRTGIYFHVGNKMADTEGCILLGLWFNHGSNSIANSRKALADFARFMGTQDFMLVIS